jgi:bacterioferritin (cytochrome b1)
LLLSLFPRSRSFRLRIEEWNLTKVGSYFQEEYMKELQHAQAMRMHQEMMASDRLLVQRGVPRSGNALSGQRSAPKGATAAKNLQQKLNLTTGLQRKIEV